MSYEDDLVNDLASDSDEELPPPSEQPIYHNETVPQSTEEESLDAKIEVILQHSISLQDQLSQLDINSITDISKHLKVFNIIPELKERLATYDESTSDFLKLISNTDYENEEIQFIERINKLISLINQEIEILFKFIKFKYSIVFPELESIITNPIDYIKIIQIIKQDLINIKHYEPQFKSFLNNDKILILIMSGLTNAKKQFQLNDKDFAMILNNCFKVNDLIEISEVLFNFIEKKIITITPNLFELIGSKTTSQLLVSCGSLEKLASTASCNLPSKGKKELSSISKKLTSKNISMGYIFNNDLIKYLPIDQATKGMKMLSGKIILAARIDLQKSCPDGSIGKNYKTEIVDKINKSLVPPEAKGDKALPIPMEYKSKKRGGRKIKKLKEKFKISELAKAQNKLEFGKQEDSYINQFGEEVGFGIIKNSSLRKFKINPNTTAKLSKDLTNRLQNNHDEKSKHLDTLELDNHEPVHNNNNNNNNNDDDDDDDNGFGDIIMKKNKWVNGSMKK